MRLVKSKSHIRKQSLAMDFGELKNDANFIEKTKRVTGCFDKIEENIQAALNFKDYDNLSTEDKVKFDLYLSYSINSLYFMYAKLQGLDPNEHGIKNELARVRQAMMRDKQIYECKALRPRVDKAAAKRFVKHGIHYRGDRQKNNEEEPPQNKRIKWDDSD